ncbi:hypothetical protein FRC17_002355 [Serendipita sp. 399]|nr:hypothetical protein FRC17_002355 [Serendipita sp. 399]
MSLQVGSPGNVAARARHRRQTSLSEPSIDATSLESESSHAQSAQTDASSQDQDQITAAARNTLSRTGSRRQSTVHSRPTESLLNPYAAEMEALRQELIGVRVELIDTKRELWETNEAKEASDVCLKALKEFIAENSIGDAPQSTTTAANTAGSSSSPLRGISLPPLPTDNIDHLGDDEDENRTPIATHAHSNSGATTKRGWGLGFWGISSNPAPDVSASSSTVKVSSSGHDSVSHSSSPPASTNTKSPMIPVGSISSLVSKWRRTENGSTSSSSSSPSISSVHTTAISDSPTSPPVGESPTAAHSTKSSIASAFRWPSQVQAKPTSEAPTTDNYTPAPRPGSLKKRPSAYSSVVNRTPSGPNRKETVMTIFSYDQHESIQPYSEDDELSPLSLDSTLTTTPPLTDTEGAGTNPSTSGSDREPDSPVSDHGFSLQARISSSESIHQSTSTLEVHKEEVTAITTSIPIHLSPRPPPLSPGIQMAHSPATLSPKVMGGTLGVEGRPRARSRAASNAVMMERIDEVAVASTGGEAFVAVRL